MYLLFIPYVLQLLFIIHIIRNGRSSSWIWLIILTPFIGALVYFLIEVLPDIRSNRIPSIEKIRKLVNKSGRVKKLLSLIEIAPSTANYIELADEYAKIGDFENAIKILESQKKGLYAKDIAILVRLAEAYFRCQKFELSFENYSLIISLKGEILGQNAIYYLIAKYKSEPNDENLALIKHHAQSTLDPETFGYLSIIYFELGQMEKVMEVQNTLKSIRNRAKARRKRIAGKYISEINKMLKNPSKEGR